MVNLLILGSTGFIGHNMKEYFINLSDYNVYAPTHKELDLLNFQQVSSYFRSNKIDFIINCTDYAHGYNEYLENRLRVFLNLETNRNLYNKMYYFGSGAEYDRNLQISEISEASFGRSIPSDIYGLTMYTLSKYAIQSKNIYNFRLFGIFGKYESWKSRFISNSICKALNGYPITIRQDATFDYLYIDDLCKIMELMIRRDLKFSDYNIVSGMKYKLTDLANIIITQTGIEVPIYIAKDGMNKEYTASNNRLMSEISIQPENISDSIKKLINYYKSNLDLIDKYYLLYQ